MSTFKAKCLNISGPPNLYETNKKEVGGILPPTKTRLYKDCPEGRGN